MTAKSEQPQIATSEIYEPVVRLVITLIVFGIINAILVSLPMLQTMVIPSFPFSITSIITAIFGIIMIIVLLSFHYEIVPKVQHKWSTSPEKSTIVRSIVLLVIVVIAYRAFNEIIMQTLFLAGVSDIAWTYPLIFLVLAAIPLYTLGMSLYCYSGKVNHRITSDLAEATGD